VFNYYVEAQGLPWRAFSRGLRLEPAQVGLSPLAVSGLRARDIQQRHTAVDCAALGEEDLIAAERRIALCGREHPPMVSRRFPLWEQRIEFWDVEDADRCAPEVALARTENRVMALLEELRSAAGDAHNADVETRSPGMRIGAADHINLRIKDVQATL